MLKIAIDKQSGSAVLLAQVALKPRVHRRNRPDSRYFYAHSMKGLSGVGSHTIPERGKLPAVPVYGFKTPGTLESAILEKHRRTTMDNCIECGKHPLDALNETCFKLALLTDLISIIPEDSRTFLSGKALAGLYWILQDAENVLDATLNHHKEVSS